MAKAKAETPPAPAASATAPQAPQEGQPAAPSDLGPERDPDAFPASLAAALGVGLAYDHEARTAAGNLPATVPEIPAELDARLNPRERRTVWHMIAGLSYQQALDACGVAPRAELRDKPAPPHVLAAYRAALTDIASKAGISRNWIIAQTVGLYRRASAAEEVLDRRGRPTGMFTFQGPTAAKCLTMLAEWCPELAPRKGIAPSDVAALLHAVASRGRPMLHERRARVLDHAAPHQEPKSLTNQAPDSADSSITSEGERVSP